jgi:hypothetical protein
MTSDIGDALARELGPPQAPSEAFMHLAYQTNIFVECPDCKSGYATYQATPLTAYLGIYRLEPHNSVAHTKCPGCGKFKFWCSRKYFDLFAALGFQPIIIGDRASRIVLDQLYEYRGREFTEDDATLIQLEWHGRAVRQEVADGLDTILRDAA